MSKRIHPQDEPLRFYSEIQVSSQPKMVKYLLFATNWKFRTSTNHKTRKNSIQAGSSARFSRPSEVVWKSKFSTWGPVREMTFLVHFTWYHPIPPVPLKEKKRNTPILNVTAEKRQNENEWVEKPLLKVSLNFKNIFLTKIILICIFFMYLYIGYSIYKSTVFIIMYSTSDLFQHIHQNEKRTGKNGRDFSHFPRASVRRNEHTKPNLCLSLCIYVYVLMYI